MKKIITILGLLLIPISYTSATFGEVQLDLDLGECSGNYCLDENFNFIYDNGVNSYNFWVITMGGRNWNTADNLFGWYNKQFYFTTSNGYYVNDNYYYKKGIPTQYCISDLDTYCESNFENINENFYKLPFNGITIWNATNVGFRNQGVCFRTSEKRYCFNNDNKTSTPIDGLRQGKSITNKDVFVGLFSSSPITNTTPTEQYTCPTIQQLIDTYPQQYNTGLCYSNSLIYSGGQFTTITPKTIFELYPTYVQLQNDINNYNNYCKAPNTQETCQGAFNGKNEEYTLISKIPQDVMPLQLYAYCNLTLNQDPNSTTCTANTGAINNGIGIDNIIDNIGKTPITVITPGTPPKNEGNGTGSVFDKYTQKEDETKRRNVIQKAEDTIQTMKEIYAKLTGIFRARQGKDGIVPPLITGLIALIILYKLFKK